MFAGNRRKSWPIHNFLMRGPWVRPWRWTNNLVYTGPARETFVGRPIAWISRLLAEMVAKGK
jgi:hypothetical protein